MLDAAATERVLVKDDGRCALAGDPRERETCDGLARDARVLADLGSAVTHGEVAERVVERGDLRARLSDGVRCVDFAKVFAEHDEELYVDLIHFNDEGCRLVAERIADEVVAGWNCVLAA